MARPSDDDIRLNSWQSHIRTAWATIKRFVRNTIVQADFMLGAIVGVGVGFWAFYNHSVRADEGTVLNTDIGAAVGLLAVTLAAMTLILSFLRGFYKGLIRKLGGASDFFYPFQAIAVVSGTAAVSGIVSSLDAGTSPLPLSSILFGLSVGLLTWAIVGAVQLVFLFVRHGIVWLDVDDALSQKAVDIPIPIDLDDDEDPDPDGGPDAAQISPM